MIHVPAPCSHDGITGIATIQRHRDALSLSIALERHASRIFAKGARPSGHLNAQNVKSGAVADNLARSFGAMHSGDNSGKVAVLYDGITFTPSEYKSVDLQYIEILALQNHEITKAFNIIPTIIRELVRTTLYNSEQIGR